MSDFDENDKLAKLLRAFGASVMAETSTSEAKARAGGA